MMHSTRVLPVGSGSIRPANASRSSASSGKMKQRKKRLPPLVLSARSFAAYWTFLVTLHGLHAVFLISCCRLYWYLEHPYLSYYADLIAPPENRQFKAFGVVLGLLGVFNAIECVGLVLASIHARRPAVLGKSIVTASRELPFRVRESWERKTIHSSHSSSDVMVERHLSRVGGMIRDAVGVFGIQSTHFRVLYTLREFVEVGAQIVQSYTFSRLITRVWINHVFVILVVLNCTSTALLYPALRRWERIAQFVSLPSVLHPVAPPQGIISQHLQQQSKTKKRSGFSPAFARLMCILIDCVLNVGTSIILPAIVFWHYARQYEPDEFSFPLALLYSDTEFLSLIQENQAIFARSKWDAVYKLVPHLNIFFCLLVVASMLRNAQVSGNATITSSPRSSHSSKLDSRSTKSGPLYNEFSYVQRHFQLQKKDKSTISRIKQYFVTVTFIAIAITVMCLHLHATLRSSSAVHARALCRQGLNPWFSSKDSCAVVEFNCHRQSVRSPPVDAFDWLDPTTVSTVLFTHCPALVVPPAIRSFSSLIGLEIYNCTVVEWGTEAALSNDLHPHIIFLVFALVNMTGLPPGVLQTPFPEKLGDIELSHTNLSSVPASLSTVWANVALVYIEYSLFVDAPAELLSIPALSELSLIGNGISVLPEHFSEMIVTDSYVFLALCSNPLESLPKAIRHDLTFGFLSLENTEMTELPEWVSERVDENVYLSGSPICSLPTESSFVQASCSSRDSRTSGRYPLELVAPLRLP